MTETYLWKHNILNWYEFLENHSSLKIRERQSIRKHVEHSIEQYEKGRFSFFAQNLAPNQHWRAYKDCKVRCCFLDIETTGLSKEYDEVTMIGLYDGKESRIFTNGRDIDQFPKAINKYECIVTFNGSCFDLPFLERSFGMRFPQLHIDLRFLLKKLGYCGGLKAIERKLGIKREQDLEEVDGFEAVRLWYRYKKGDKAALQLLRRYLLADIENLKTLMDLGFKKMKDKEFYSVISQA